MIFLLTLIRLAAQLSASFFAVKGLIAADFSLYPILAVVLVILDIIEIASGRLKSSGVSFTFFACAVSCFIFQSINIYSISVGYVVMQAAFFALSVIIMFIGLIISIITR